MGMLLDTIGWGFNNGLEHVFGVDWPSSKNETVADVAPDGVDFELWLNT
jgi:hypothetical protein